MQSGILALLNFPTLNSRSFATVYIQQGDKEQQRVNACCKILELKELDSWTIHAQVLSSSSPLGSYSYPVNVGARKDVSENRNKFSVTISLQLEWNRTFHSNGHMNVSDGYAQYFPHSSLVLVINPIAILLREKEWAILYDLHEALNKLSLTLLSFLNSRWAI